MRLVVGLLGVVLLVAIFQSLEFRGPVVSPASSEAVQSGVGPLPRAVVMHGSTVDTVTGGDAGSAEGARFAERPVAGAAAVLPLPRGRVHGSVVMEGGPLMDGAEVALKWHRLGGRKSGEVVGGLAVAPDPNGEFFIDVECGRDLMFFLTVTTRDFGVERRQWVGLECGDIYEVGEIRVRRGSAIRGVLRKSSGEVLAEDWVVYAEPIDGGGASISLEDVYSALVDSIGGGFVVEGVPPGEYALRAFSDEFGWKEGPRIELSAGEVLPSVDFVCDVPIPGALLVRVVGFPIVDFAGGDPSAGMYLADRLGALRSPVAVSSSPGLYLFSEALELPGMLVVRSPYHRELAMQVAMGEASVRVRLVPSGELLLQVAGAGGEPLGEGFTVTVTYPDHLRGEASSREIVSHHAKGSGSSVRLQVVPVALSILVEASGFTSQRASIELGPERRFKRLDLEMKREL